MNRRAMSDSAAHPGLLRRIAAVCLAFSLVLPLAACGDSGSNPADAPLAGASIGGPFTLVDKDGRQVTWDSFKGKWRIVYFGYTFCPDACPTDMTQIIRGYNEFAKAHPDLADKVQPIFISIDPARDTPKVVGEWTAAFSPKLLGLTGTPAQVKQAADAFHAYYKKGDETAGGYLMDHSRAAYLMDPDGKPIALLPADKGGDAVAADLGKWVK